MQQSLPRSPRTPKTPSGKNAQRVTNVAKKNDKSPDYLSRHTKMNRTNSSMELWNQPPPNKYAQLAAQIFEMCDLRNISEEDMKEISNMNTKSHKNHIMLAILQQLVDRVNLERKENTALRKENEALKDWIMNYMNNDIDAGELNDEQPIALMPPNLPNYSHLQPNLSPSTSSSSSSDGCKIEEYSISDEEILPPKGFGSKMVIMKKPSQNNRNMALLGESLETYSFEEDDNLLDNNRLGKQTERTSVDIAVKK